MARADRLRPDYSLTADLSVPFLQSTPEQTIWQRAKTRLVYGAPHFTLLSGDAGMHIARQVGEILQHTVPDNPPAFSNNEVRALVPKDVATRDVYVIQSTNGNPDASLTQLKLIEEGAKGAGANRITAVVTHLPYSRQDRREQPGAPEAARLSAREIMRAGSHDPEKRRHESRLTASANLILVDIHSEKPLLPLTEHNGLEWANLDSFHVLAPKIQQLIASRQFTPTIAFPDKGAAKRYETYAEAFGGGMENAAIIQKERDISKNNSVTISSNQEDLSGKVAGTDVFLIDDIIDTAGSILQAAKRLKQEGAKSVWVVATHGIFSKDALQKMNDDAIDGCVITDTIPPREDVLDHPKIEVVSIAPLIATAIQRIEKRQPIADLTKSMSPGFEHSYMRLSRRINRQRLQHHD